MKIERMNLATGTTEVKEVVELIATAKKEVKTISYATTPKLTVTHTSRMTLMAPPVSKVAEEVSEYTTKKVITKETADKLPKEISEYTVIINKAKEEIGLPEPKTGYDLVTRLLNRIATSLYNKYNNKMDNNVEI